MIGAAAAAANLLCELRIAEKKEDKLMKNKNGKVILVNWIASSILSLLPVKPGAISPTKAGIKISVIKTKKNSPQKSKLKISFANLFELDLLLTNSEE